jgi:sphingomyelin phosphodiesterase acid-like 3
MFPLTRTLPRFTTILKLSVALACLVIALAPLRATLAQSLPSSQAVPSGADQTKPAEVHSIPAFMISDVHFDPFHDPAKVKALVAAPVSEWKSILAAPASANQEQAFDSLQQTCNARGVDTPFVLLRSSLQAMQAHLPNAKFMVVSGDLIAHGFTCRYSTLFPNAAPGDYQAFVLKTLSFVVRELRAAFPEMPVYVALGNNDTGCGDYKLDANGSFLAEAGKIIAEGLPPTEREDAIKQFAAGGYYSVPMAAPMHDTRLIVVNDLFLSPKYTTCAGKSDTAAATAQVAWLEQQLTEAQKAGQQVWVMGHIPPGIDPYSTAEKLRNVCGGEKAVTFLASNQMADLLVDHSSVVRLAIFAHTHMDEMRLLKPDGKSPQAANDSTVAVKMVSSISPVDGNNPSFTIARVDPSTAVLEDYEVIAASNQTGVATRWVREYDYRDTYHEKEFTPATLGKLIGEFRADSFASTAISQAYIRDYFVGDASRELTPFWPQYVCALDNRTSKSFAACVCSSGN